MTDLESFALWCAERMWHHECCCMGCSVPGDWPSGLGEFWCDNRQHYLVSKQFCWHASARWMLDRWAKEVGDE
jgi:hypothetical protein